MTPEQRVMELLTALFNPQPHPMQSEWSDDHSLPLATLAARLAQGIRDAENAAYEKAAQVAEVTEATPIPPVGWVIAAAIRALKDKGE